MTPKSGSLWSTSSYAMSVTPSTNMAGRMRFEGSLHSGTVAQHRQHRTVRYRALAQYLQWQEPSAASQIQPFVLPEESSTPSGKTALYRTALWLPAMSSDKAKQLQFAAAVVTLEQQLLLYSSSCYSAWAHTCRGSPSP